jgi:hypothetical protein
MNGGKAVVVWRNNDDVMFLRFEDRVTDGFKSLEGKSPDSFLLVPNGLCVQGQVNAVHDAMTAREVETLIDQNRDRLQDPDNWGEGRFRRKIPMLVLTVRRSGRLVAPERPALEGPRPTSRHLPHLVGSDERVASGGDDDRQEFDDELDD